MGTRYICDVCGKLYDVKGDSSPIGYQIAGMVPDEWAIISYFAPKEPEPPQKSDSAAVVRPSAVYPEKTSKVFLVCSQACAEKALDEAKEYLRQAFEKVVHSE